MAKRTSTSTTATQSAATSMKAASAKPVVEKAAVAAPKAQASRAKAAAPQVTFMITPETIAQRAYDIWRQKGGMEMENWLQAERELRGETAGK